MGTRSDSTLALQEPVSLLNDGHEEDASASITHLGKSIPDQPELAPPFACNEIELSRRPPSDPHTWLPATLHWAFLTILITLAMALGLLVSLLTSYSNRNQGLTQDEGSLALFFGWRFLPTLVATIYALFISSLLCDVRRTETFVRLSKPEGASPTDTLCLPARSWWHDPHDALSRSRNGGSRGWTLFFTSITYIFTLLISPLSAGLLSPVISQVSESVNLTQVTLPAEFPWQLNSTDSIIFQTISGAILGKQASPWSSAELAVLPFWLSAEQANLVRAVLPQQWVADTWAYKVELTCSTMELVDKRTTTVYDNYSKLGYPGVVYKLNSSDGCSITMQDVHDTNLTETPYWNRNDSAWWLTAQDPGPLFSVRGSGNSTKDCGDRTVLAVKNSSGIQAQLCSAEFFLANVRASVSMTQSSTVVEVDATEFSVKRKPMDLYENNIRRLKAAFHTPDWSNKFFNSGNYSFAGPLLALAASDRYKNQPSQMTDRPQLLQQATRLYQQFLGETLLSTLTSGMGRGLSNQSFSGEIYYTERRIVVNPAIGAILAAFMILSGGLVTIVAYNTRLRRRHLDINHDPSQILTVASLIKDNQTRAVFVDLDRSSKRVVGARLTNLRFVVRNGSLSAADEAIDSEARGGKKETIRSHDPRPAVLRTWMGPTFLFCLCSLLAGMISLYYVSCKGGLRQKAFVFQRDLEVFQAAATFAPYSILPTLLAVGVKLWLGAIGDALKRLQPYVSMLKRPTPVLDSVLAEYSNTPLALITKKAMGNSHLVLGLVGSAALASELFTVGMSALWDLRVKPAYHSLLLDRSLELPNIPRLFEVDSGPFHDNRPIDHYRTPIIGDIYRGSLQSWLYSGAIEILQSVATPAWSKDDWSFLPLNMDDVRASVSKLNIASLIQYGLSTNLTLHTPALRGRLQCHSLDYASNTSRWLERIDFTNETAWNQTNRPSGLMYGYVLKSFANRGSDVGYFTCCANQTNGIPGDAAIGYWSDLDYSARKFTSSMTVLWIVGQPLNGTFRSTNESISPDRENSVDRLWVWPEQPKLSFLNCTPIFERADANLTVALDTGMVQNYSILSEPEPITSAWSDPYLPRNTSVDYTQGYFRPGGQPFDDSTFRNVTASWGYVFLDALTNSGTAAAIRPTLYYTTFYEDLGDGIFNFRYPGLNADFMSYCMLHLVGNDKHALLDPTTVSEMASKVFGIFFKHYASENVSSTLGGQIYRPIGEKLPWSLGPAWDLLNDLLPPDQQGGFIRQNDTVPMERSVNATLIVPVEQLVMSPVAVYLCISALVIIILTTIVIYTANRRYLKALPRDVDTHASVLAFVYGSEKLLAWSKNRPASKPWYRSWGKREEKYDGLRARLGPFVDSKGEERWGIELVDVETENDERPNHAEGEWIELRQHEPRGVESDEILPDELQRQQSRQAGSDDGDIGVQMNFARASGHEIEGSDAGTEPDVLDRLLDEHNDKTQQHNTNSRPSRDSVSSTTMEQESLVAEDGSISGSRVRLLDRENL